MTRFCIALALVAVVGGCGSAFDQRYSKVNSTSDRVTDYVWQNPICLILCNSSLNAAASNAVGEGNTQSSSQSNTQQSGGQ